MKVLFVADRAFPAASGSQLYLHEMAERLVAAGHRASILTTDAVAVDYMWNRGAKHIEEYHTVHNEVPITRVPVWHTPLAQLSFPALRHLNAACSSLSFVPPGVLRAIARFTPPVPGLDIALQTGERPAIVHAINITLDGISLAAGRFADRSHIPLVLTPFLHTGNPRFYTMRHQVALLRRADAVIAQTPLERDALLALDVPEKRVHVISVGIDPVMLTGGNGARLRKRYKIEGPIVYYIGVQAYDKGAMHLVQAMQKLWGAGVQATLVLAGPLTSTFSRFLQGIPHEDKERMRILGPVYGEDKRDLLAAGDVFALPSRTDSFGIVYLEAWLYNTPVIGARAGGVPGVIQDGRDGLLVEFGNIDELANAIARLLADPEGAREMGRVGRERVLSEMTWEEKYKQLEQLYASLI